MQSGNMFDSYLRRNWDLQEFRPSGDVWSRLTFSLREDSFDHSLKQSWKDFDETPSATVFDRIFDDLQQTNGLRSSFDTWESEVATPGFASLQTELNEVALDRTIQQSYSDWNSGNASDLWMKLEEELARESVWMRLRVSLSDHYANQGWWKRWVAAAAMLVFFFNVADEKLPFRDIQNGALGTINISKANTASVSVDDQSYDDRASNTSVANSNEEQPTVERQDPGHQNTPADKLQSEQVSPQQMDVATEPETDDITALDKLNIAAPLNALVVRDNNSRERKEHFSLEAGPQLALLTVKSDSRMRTTTPGLGYAAGVNFKYKLAGIRLSHGIAYARYKQDAADYINGRYRTGEQQISSLQFRTTAGVVWKRFDLYGGILLSRSLSGVEKLGSTVTKVYTFEPITPGIVAGVDYTLLQLPKSRIGAGLQYSWIRGMSNSPSSMTNIQGVRANLVYTF